MRARSGSAPTWRRSRWTSGGKRWTRRRPSAQTLTGGAGDTVTVGGQTPPRGRLHEGLPVRAGAGEHPGRRAVRRRARPADPGARLRPPVQPAGAGRADQRSGPGNARPAAGAAGRVCRHGAAGQPRPRLPRSRRDLGDRRRGRRALDRICRRLYRHAGAARTGCGGQSRDANAARGGDGADPAAVGRGKPAAAGGRGARRKRRARVG